MPILRAFLISMLGIFAISTLNCRANLGETIDQCVVRYGRPMPPSGTYDPGKVGATATVFQKDGFAFEVFLFDGVVGCESITKTDGSLMSDKEKEQIIQRKSTSGDWAKPVLVHGQAVSMRSDGAAIFSYPASGPLILVMSKKYMDLFCGDQKEVSELSHRK